MHVDAGRSMEQLRERVATLRTERDAARDEAKTSAEDKQEADLAWNELVSSLKSEAYVRVFFYLKKKKPNTTHPAASHRLFLEAFSRLACF